MELDSLLDKGLNLGSQIFIELDEHSRGFLKDTGIGDFRNAVVWGVCRKDSGQPDGYLKILVRTHQGSGGSKWTDITANCDMVRRVSSVPLLKTDAIAQMVVRSRFGIEASPGSISLLEEQISGDKEALNEHRIIDS